ncbi:MAG: hypothetical protein LBU35_03150, partial [Holosporales bacterium]|nr:hypothetical protein [Holosporales bacterium]
MQPVKEEHYACFSEKEFCEFLKGLDPLYMNTLTRLALKLLVLTFVRSGELRGNIEGGFIWQVKDVDAALQDRIKEMSADGMSERD